MSAFEEVLTASAESLLKMFYRLAIAGDLSQERRLRLVGRRMELHPTQLICALGFNPALRQLPDVLSVLGFARYEALAQRRNELFVSDIYRRLPIDDVLAIYKQVRDDQELLPVMQYLLEQRLENIEKRIEATVNSLVIERYKKEMRAIYNDGVASIEFAEMRLDKTDSGFRALLNEVNIITEARLIPVGDIFFRDSILAEEKRKLISKGVIGEELVRARLEDERLPAAERAMLEEQLALGIRPARPDARDGAASPVPGAGRKGD